VLYLTCAYEFNASHKMWNPAFTDEQNRKTFGKCANPAGHGHRYRLEITFGRPVSREDPFVISGPERARLIDEVLEPRLAYADLNTAFGEAFISSGERIAEAVWNLIERRFETEARLTAVRVIETKKNSFVYRGGKPEGDAV
jgi:6-pyruvoyltetrahydropterin/6-carboxytetrahydropterin synthase